MYQSSLALFSENFGENGKITPQSNIKEVNTASSSQPDEGPSDGERMTAELRDIISQFMQKVSLKISQDITRLLLNAQTAITIYEPSSVQVEEFKLSVNSMSVSIAEQQMVSVVFFLYIAHRIIFESSIVPSFFFCMCINVKSVHCQVLRSIMEAQDQLERKYISKKEEHRALEMQNYMGLSRNTGTFDPNRLKRPCYCISVNVSVSC